MTTPTSDGDDVIFDSDDAQTVGTFLDEAYGNSLRIEADPGRLTFRRTPLDLVSVDHMELGGRVSFSTDPITIFTVMECRSGSGEYVRQGMSDHLGPGAVVATAAPGHGYAGYAGPLSIRLLNLDLATLAAVSRGILGREEPLEFHGLAATTEHDRQLWARMVDFVTLAAQPVRVRPGGLAETDLARMVARTALAVFPNTTWDPPEESVARRDDRDASAAAVRRAISFISSSADSDIDLGDIAAAARTSPRALQIAFRRHAGTTPMRYLQRARLHQARRALQDADGDMTVSGVASRWGFYNHGRFAASYRAEFGELPSETLQRSGGDDPSPA